MVWPSPKLQRACAISRWVACGLVNQSEFRKSVLRRNCISIRRTLRIRKMNWRSCWFRCESSAINSSTLKRNSRCGLGFLYIRVIFTKDTFVHVNQKQHLHGTIGGTISWEHRWTGAILCPVVLKTIDRDKPRFSSSWQSDGVQPIINV